MSDGIENSVLRQFRLLGSTLGDLDAENVEALLLPIASRTYTSSDVATLVTSIRNAAAVASALPSGDSVPPTFEGIVSVLVRCGQVLSGLQDLELTSPELGEAVVGGLIDWFVRAWHPRLFSAAVLLGMAGDDLPGVRTLPSLDEQGNLVRLDESGMSVRFDKVRRFLEDPGEHLRAEYFPDGLESEEKITSALGLFLPRLGFFLSSFGALVGYQCVERGGPVVEMDLSFGKLGGAREFVFGLSIERSLAPIGIRIVPHGGLGFEANFGQFVAAIGLSLDSPFVFGLEGLRSDLPSFRGEGSVRRSAVGSQSAFRIGALQGTRVECGQISLAAECELGNGFAGFVDVMASHGRVVIRPGDGDGFLASILPSDGLEVQFQAGIGWSSQKGLYFEGSAGLQAVLPVRVDVVGVLEVSAICLDLRADENGLSTSASANFTVHLGPVSASVEKVGVQTSLTFPSEGGNLGPANLSLGFKPPSGLALSISAGPVSGGGFISYEESTERYVGALALSISEVSLSAVGLLETRAPDVDGYSFLVIISAEFTPLQLGFGFTLNGVGGLCGIQRSVNTEALRTAVTDGSLAPLLFSRDPLAQADRIVSAITRVFPATADRYVFGPLFKLGWGTPTLVTAVLGIVIELPEPIRISLIGQIAARFPKPEGAVVILNIDIVGFLDPAEKRLFIQASLRDSRVMGWALSGDMAFLLTWGDEPEFLLSVGGFHRDFRPPPSFPTLRRLTLALGAGNNPRISLQAYLAVTSNTFQIGARAELYVEAGPFSVSGHLAFDALFIFSPFSFKISFSAAVALRWGSTTLAGISLSGELSGPRPWHIQGEASVSLLFFDVSVSFEHTFGGGGEAEQLPPPVRAWERLETALNDLRNWSGPLPVGSARGVVLASPGGTPAPLRLDPVGTLQVQQQVVPLRRTLTRLGEARLTGPTRLEITAITPPTGATTAVVPGSEATSAVCASFARGQYLTLTDAEKLSAPSFERMESGTSLNSSRVASVPPTAFTTRPRPVRLIRARATTPVPSSDVLGNALVRMAMELPPGHAEGPLGRFQPRVPDAPRLSLAPEGWTVLSQTNLSVAEGVDTSSTYGSASEALRQRTATAVGGRDQWVLAPAFEARR